MIIRAIKRIKKCVDDVLGWAQTLLQLFHDTCFFLYHTSSAGVIQNPKKFVWGQRELEYVGFWIKENGVKPTDETLSAISQFPRPTDLTGIRSWFGLIKQVAFSFSKNTLMDPFRNLLKKNSVYKWDDSMQEAFETAKVEIVRLVAEGVTSFQIDSHICIVTDWSRTGIGFVMWQKRCQCEQIHPTCCQGGWTLITCGSRFCTPAETRYHPIEGELLGVTWALEKTQYYTLGSNKLLVLVDHKPLLGLLTSRNLGDIENPRLLHLAERLLRWRFNIQHIAGAKNFAPDALSRSPVKPVAGERLYEVRASSRPDYYGQTCALSAISKQIQDNSDDLEAQVLATTANDPLLITTWNDLKTAGQSDNEYSELLHSVNSDTDPKSWSDEYMSTEDTKSICLLSTVSCFTRAGQ
jgi:hypothetical protein